MKDSGVQAEKVALGLSHYFDDPFSHASIYWPDLSTLLLTVLLSVCLVANDLSRCCPVFSR